MPTHSGGSAAQRRGLIASIVAWVALWLKACLDAWEEALQGLLRESLSITQRAINGASAWTLSVFNRDYKAQLRGRWAVLEQQYSWWGQTDVGDKRSTLNAVLARKFDGDSSSPAAAGAATASAATAPAGVATSQDGLRHRRPTSSSRQQPQNAASHPATPSAAGLSEIEPLPADGFEQTARAEASQRQRPQQQHAAGAAGADAAAESGAQQWWDTPATWLSEIADEATEAAAAAQEAATAAVQQAASTMTHAVEEAAATAASWARSMRAVFVEPPAGWGVHEAIKQTGLLEDVSLYGQLLISRIFDKLRWLLGKLTFSSVAQTPKAATAAARQRTSALHSPSSSSSTAATAGPRPGFFERLRSPRHPAAMAAAGAGAEAGGVAAAGRRGLAGGLRSVGADGRLKLRSVTSVDLPNTHRLSLEAEEDSDNDQQGYTADESGLSDSSSGAYDDAQDDASSEASCSSTSSWTQQQQHRPVSAASALAAAGTASSAAMATSAAAEFADLPGPSLTVRVPQSALHGGSSSTGRDRQGKVSFAAGQQGQAAKHGAAAEGVGGDPTPFATAVVQQQHQASLTQHGPAVGSSSGKGGPPAGKAKGARGSGSRGGGSKHRQRMPEGLGAVLPGRGRRGLQRSHSGPAVSALKEVSSAGQVIRMAGYPLEVHEVVTHDGYLLRMERIPQPASRDAVFMMHGVLDTSLTWVAGGITGSQAFAAWDRGFDVWLGTSRCNPPHEAADPARRGSRYWVYSNNEVGVYDMGAQMDHIHAVKMRELTALGRTPSNSRRTSTTDITTAATARSGRWPSGRRSSGSTASSRQPIPEHADVLEGVVDADALVGIQHVGMGAAAAVGSGGAGKPAQGMQDVAPSGCAGADMQLPSEPHKASSAPPAVTDSSSVGLKPQAIDMSRAQSAAEADLQAAAEAAEAFSRQRAARMAAGVSPTGAGYWAEQREAQEVGDQRQQQQQAAGQGVLAPLTPTAHAAASAAARAASALGSAVATAAAAAGGMIGLGPSTPVSPTSTTADSHVVDANGQGQGTAASGLNILPGSRNGSTTASARGATSGLLERLLGGTVPASDAAFGRKGSCMGLQTQGSGMRQSASAPDVSALAALGDVADTSSSALRAAGNASDVVAAGVGKLGCSRSGSGSSAAGSSQGEGSTGRARRARRGSCPYFSLEGSPVAARCVQQEFDPDGGGDLQLQQQHPEQQQQQEQQSVGVSPFSQQQPPDLQQPQLFEDVGVQAPQQLQHCQQEQPFPAFRQPQQQQAQVQGHHGYHHHQQQQASQGVSSPTAGSRPTAGGTAHVTAARSSSWGLEPRPYTLRVVAHSLGGLLMLIYCTQRARAGRPHHISRLILLSPAGFHPIIPGMFKPLVYIWRPLMLWTQLVWRQQGFPVQLPTFVARMLAFKLSIDTSKLPAVGDLLRSMARLLLGGDRSAWDRALLMPHYTAKGMPLLSSRQVLHFIQLYLTGRCQLFDYGSEAANVAAYQQRTPPVVSDAFHMLRDVPVHLVAGEHDGVIPASNIRHHYAAMRAAGMDVSYREFDYGHMDFTFSAKEELGWYVMSLLMRT